MNHVPIVIDISLSSLHCLMFTKVSLVILYNLNQSKLKHSLIECNEANV